MNQNTIVRMLLVETGTYNDMARRPYHTALDQHLLAQVQDATMHGARINAESLAGVAGQVLRPTTNATGIVQITNGWEQPRYRFLMEVTSEGYQGGELVQYVAGYTDHIGISHGGHLDPRMRFYINSVVSTRRMRMMTPGGAVSKQVANRADHILSNQAHQDVRITNYNLTPHLMRPEDVFNTMGTQIMGDGLSTVYDTRSGFMDEPIRKSNRSNASSSQYLSKIMTTHQKVMRSADGAGDDLGVIMERASGLVREQTVSEDLFLAPLQRMTGFSEGQSVMYQELLQMAPHLDQVTTVVVPNQQQMFNRPTRGSAEHWTGTTHETVVATILSHSVPAILMDLMITKIAFTATNRTLDGSVQVLLADVKSFMGGEVDLSPYAMIFQQRFATEIFTDLSRNGQLDLEIQVSFDVLGDTIIDVSMQGQPAIRYTTPSFADALFTPIWGENADTLRKLTFDIDSICTNLEVSHRPGIPSIQVSNQYGGYAPQAPSVVQGTAHEEI